MITTEQVRQYWDAQPCNIRHSALPAGTREYFDEVEARKYWVEPHIPSFADFPAWKGKDVLDVGCGIGTDAINFARAGAWVVGIDLSSKSLELARKRANLFRLWNTFFHRGNIETEMTGREEYDLIYSFGALHHMADPHKALVVMHKLLRPGATLKVMVYNRWSWKNLRIKLGLDQPEAQAGCPIARTYSKRSARGLIKAHGFKVTGMSVEHIFPYKVAEYRQYRYVKEWYWRWMPKPLFRWLEHRIGWHLCITAVAE